MKKIGIIGAGSWGTALAVNLARNNHQVTIWSIMEDEIKMLNEHREHLDKLPGVKLAESMKDAKLILLTDYRGINVEDVTNLRTTVRNANASYRVIKNNIKRGF